MKKKIVGILVCTLLIAAAVLPVAGTFDIDQKTAIGFQFKSVLNPHPIYEPEDIDLEDAAYHKSSDRYHLEWWYFEGIFNNGYSIVIGIVIISKDNHGRCLLSLHTYKDTELELLLRKTVNIKDLEASEIFPLIIVSGKEIMRLDRELYNDIGKWVYNISIEIDNQEANLKFTGLTKGYRGEILRGWYGPVLPKADVEGTLKINGETINVSGYGYHEHACEITFPIWEWGWYWSKIVSDSYTLVWAKMMNTRWWEQIRAAIFSQDQGGYINIDPENIKFKATKHIIDKWRLIPTKFVLNISDPDNSIYINATMETINTHHIGILKIINYWRCHLKLDGEITFGTSTEKVKDQVQVLEIMRFR